MDRRFRIQIRVVCLSRYKSSKVWKKMFQGGLENSDYLQLTGQTFRTENASRSGYRGMSGQSETAQLPPIRVAPAPEIRPLKASRLSSASCWSASIKKPPKLPLSCSTTDTHIRNSPATANTGLARLYKSIRIERSSMDQVPSF